MKIILIDQEEPVTLNSEKVIIHHGEGEIFTNLNKEALVAQLTKDLFFILAQGLMSDGKDNNE